MFAFFGTTFGTFSRVLCVAKSEFFQLFERIIENIIQSRYIGIYQIIGKLLISKLCFPCRLSSFKPGRYSGITFYLFTTEPKFLCFRSSPGPPGLRSGGMVGAFFTGHVCKMATGY